MLQNKQSLSTFSLRRWLFLLAAFVVGLSFVTGLNSERTFAQQPPNAKGAAQKPRTKRLTPLRTSETADGSRVTITSDGELNDYSAYRSGDRFIVVVPQAEGGGGGASGRGFEGAQVEKRGKDLVYTFKLQPGATARVNQRFNRLDVQFSAAKDATKNTNAAVVKPTPTPTPVKRTPIEEAGITKPPTNVNVQPTPDARRTPDANVNSSAAASATPFAIPSPTSATVPSVAATPTLAPVATPTGAGDQLAQAQPTPPAPASIITNAPATTSPSVGAVVLRNWPWLIAALLAIGIGLLFVSRLSGRDRDQSRTLPPPATKPVTVEETQTPELKPATPSTAATLSATSTSSTSAANASSTTATTAATTGATAATAGAAGLAATIIGKLSKKQKKKAEQAKRLAEANERKKAGSSSSASTGAGAATASKTTQDVGASTAATTEAIIAGAAIVASGAAKVDESEAVETDAVETKAVESKATETKAVEAKAIEAITTETMAVEVKATEAKPVEPSVAFAPERIEVEIKKLLAGESYDESYINATEAGTRQLVSTELMSAIAGRNEVRQTHARTAFLKHNYFDEATRALQSAEAPGERAAAARTLGLVGDRSATLHLTAALEDPAADVRRTSVEALTELQDPAAVSALEALRWRETSRQVPRTLIQSAIEACKAAAAEVAEETAPVLAADDDTPPLVTAESLPVALVSTETPEIETKEVETIASETKGIEVSAATKAVEVSTATPAVAEADTIVQESPHIAATEAATPEAPVAVEESPTIETKPVADETKAAREETTGIELAETKTLDVAAPTVEPAFAEEVKAEVETATPRAKTDLAGMLAAKESGLVKAREQQDRELAESAKETKAVEPVVASQAAVEFPSASLASSADELPELTLETPPVETQPAPSLVASLDAPAATVAEVASAEEEEETATRTQTGVEKAPPGYHSDFKAGSGHKPVPGEDDWLDLDADDHDVMVQSIEPFVAPATAPAEPLGPFFAENAGADVSPASQKEMSAAPPAAEMKGREEPLSLLDSLEIETFETNAAEPTPITATPIELEYFEDTTTHPPVFDVLTPVAEEHQRGTGGVKADKGLSPIDGSDESEYSTIPKGIQVRLASDDSSERAASLLALSRLNPDEAFGEICAAFDDPQDEVRNAAARALYDLNDDRAEFFTRALRESPIERRRRIGSALAGSGLADEAIGNLTGESRDKTYDAFSLLFLMAKAGEVAPLIRAIESHADNEVRLAVVKLLALSGQQEILPAFRRLAVRGSLPAEVRSAVMEAIYQISSQPVA